MKRYYVVALAAFAGICAVVAKPVDLTLGNGDVLRVEAVSRGIFRVRLSADGRFEPSLMERYGIVRTNWPALETTVREEGGVTRLSTSAGSYNGMPSRRGYDLRIHTARPDSVTVNGSKAEWTYDLPTRSVRLCASEDSSRQTPVVVEIGR